MKLRSGNTRSFRLLTALLLNGKIALILMILSAVIVKAESQSSLYYKDKQALDDAKLTGTVQAIDDFIHQHPNSAWLNNATYYRDKQALDIAKSADTVEAIDDFIQRYPNSKWLNNAIHTRDKTVYNRIKKIGTKDAFEEFLNKYPNSKWKNKVEQKLASLSKKESTNIHKIKETEKKQVTYISNERVNRALEIHESINKENAKKAALKEQQLAQLQKQKKKCYALKDKVRQYGERRLWYTLDDTGNRIYLSDQEVEEKRLDIESNYAEKCSKFEL